MLRDDVIQNLLFRFQYIDFNNINDIYFAINIAINIIVIITTTLFETLIAAAFILKFAIIIVIAVIIIIIVIFVIVIKRFIVKLIAFDFDIKKRLIMNALLDKSQNLTIIETFNGALLRINNEISLL